MFTQSMSNNVIEHCISEKNWGLLQSHCKSYIISFSSLSKEEKSIEVIRFVLKKATSLAKEHRIKESILLRNVIDNLRLEVPLKTYVKQAYDFLNYLSCALREKGCLFKAKLLTEKALKLSKKFSSLTKSTSFMNMCAISSSMGQHDKALSYANLALDYIYNELLDLKNQGIQDKILKKYAKIAIANYNQAVEEEFLGNVKQAVYGYETSLEVLTSYSIDATDLVEKVKNSLERLKKQEIIKRNSSPFVIRSKSQMRAYATNFSPIKSQRSIGLNQQSQTSKTISNKISLPNTYRTNSKQASKIKYGTNDQIKQFEPIKAIRISKKVGFIPDEKYRKYTGDDDIDIEGLKTFNDVDPKEIGKEQDNELSSIRFENEKKYSLEEKFNNKANTDVFFTESEVPKIHNRNKSEENMLIKSTRYDTFAKKQEIILEKVEETHIRKSINLKKFDFYEKKKKNNDRKTEHSPNALAKNLTKSSQNYSTRLSAEGPKLQIAQGKNVKVPYERAQTSLGNNNKKTKPTVENTRTPVPKISIKDTDKNHVVHPAMVDNEKAQVKSIETPNFEVKKSSTNESSSHSKSSSKIDLTESQKAQKIYIKNDSHHSSDCHTIKKPSQTNDKSAKQHIKTESPPPKVKNSTFVLEDNENDEALSKIIEEGSVILKEKEVKVQVKYLENRAFYIINSVCVFRTQASHKVQSTPLILYLKLKNQGYSLRKEPSIEEIFREKRLMNNGFEYYIMAFYIQEKQSWVYFHASDEESPLITGISYTEKVLAEMFKTQDIKSALPDIAKKMIIMNGVLEIKSTVALEEELVISAEDEKRIIKIQAVYRGKKFRDMIKLQKCKNTIICSHIKMCIDGPHIVKLYKVDESVLIEISKSQKSICFYGFLIRPTDYITSFYRYSHTLLLVNAVRIEQVPYISRLDGAKDSFASSDYDVEEFSAISMTFHRKDENVVILCSQLTNSNIIVKFFNYKDNFVISKLYTVSNILSQINKYDIRAFIKTISLEGQTIINTNLPQTVSKPILSEIQDQVLYHSCIKFDGILYQVAVSKLNNDLLNFTYKSGSLLKLNYNFSIPISLACEKSGFYDTLVIPMVNYMIKNMLVLKNKEILLDPTKKPIDVDRNIRKIQATFRSFRLRKKFRQLLFMKFLKKIKKPMDETIYTVLLYEKPDCYALYGVNLSEVYVKYIEKNSDVGPEYILRTNIDDLFAKRPVSPKRTKKDMKHPVRTNKGKTFITEASFSKTLLWQGKGIISEIDVFIILYQVNKHELVECHIIDKVLYIEIDSDYLPQDMSIFSKMEISKNSELQLQIKPKHIVFYQVRDVSNYVCKVHIVHRKGKFVLIVFSLKLKRYFIKPLGEDVNLTRILDNVRIAKAYGGLVLYN